MPIEMPSAPPSVPSLPPERGKEITGWKIRLYYWTRNPHVLFWSAVIIIGIGCALGKMWEPKGGKRDISAAWKALVAQARGNQEPVPELVKELTRPELSLERVLRALEARSRGRERGCECAERMPIEAG